MLIMVGLGIVMCPLCRMFPDCEPKCYCVNSINKTHLRKRHVFSLSLYNDAAGPAASVGFQFEIADAAKSWTVAPGSDTVQGAVFHLDTVK